MTLRVAPPVPQDVGALRRIVRRVRGAERTSRRTYTRWQSDVEPELGLQVRRFARPGEGLDRATRPEEVAIVADVRELDGLRAPWVAVVDPGDRLAPGAREALGRAAATAPDAIVLTGDEDHLDAAGRRVAPAIRPGPSPDLLRTRDLAGAVIAFRPEAALASGVALGTPGWRHALTLALTGPDGARAAHVSTVLAHRGSRAAAPAAIRPEASRVTGEPSVEVVIPFRDRHELLVRSVGSLLATTAWERLRVTLVDNGSTSPPPASLLSDPRVAVLRDPRAFNFSGLCNGAASRSSADVLVFLNNDTEVIEPGWLERLVAEARRPEVGAVAPLLLYPSGAVQHAGVAVGLFGVAGHPWSGLRPDEDTPFGPARAGTRNCLAVTAACLAVERRKLAAVGGFEERFVVAGQDVDLGIRLTARGYRSLCVTDVSVIHDEARSRGDRVGPGDVALSHQAYAPFLEGRDPFYSPALTRASTNCALRMAGEAW